MITALYSLIGIVVVALIGWWTWLSSCAISNKERLTLLEAQHRIFLGTVVDLRSELKEIRGILSSMRDEQVEFYKRERERRT